METEKKPKKDKTAEGALEKKKNGLLRILQILKKYSDSDHPLTQERIGELQANVEELKAQVRMLMEAAGKK